jgi:two-component system sensor histidine kinase/response regulator
VDCAENGKIGVEKFGASASGHYDAILMDIRMPVMDGCEAAKNIRSLDRPDAKTIPIIAMTGDAFEESIRAAAEAGMNDYLTKPISPQKVIETLKKHIK